MDDDGDLQVDLQDPDCKNDAQRTSELPECSNLIDDDADGKLDTLDVGCDLGTSERCRMTTFIHIHRRVHRHRGGRRHIHILRHKHYRAVCPAGAKVF